MNCTKLPYQNTGLYSKIYLDYISENPELTPFYQYKFSIEAFSNIIEDSKYDSGIRSDLVEVISEKYKSCGLAVPQNVALLNSEKTFTITTGHQLNIFTGPLFFIYKIVTTVNLCKQLKDRYPEYNFVPIYWMASEDHDSEEIDHTHIFGKKVEWEPGQTGAVGDFSTKGISELLDEFNGLPEYFSKAYSSSETLSEATVKLVHELFKGTDLVILDPNDGRLKSHFVAQMKRDIQDNINYNAVVESSTKLEEAGYTTQVQPREINLFYLEKGKRERIVQEEGQLKTYDSKKDISISELETNPERFSPNVVTRPLYQQVILPNLAYVGGPGELAYWLQLKDSFAVNNVQFPMLVPRNAALFVEQKSLLKFQKSGFGLNDFLKKRKELEKEYLEKQDLTDIDQESLEILKMFDSISAKLADADKSLEGFGEKEKSLLKKQLERLAGRLNKANKSKHEIELGQITKLKERYFPNNAPQERVWNVLNVIVDNPNYIQELIDIFDPIDRNYYLLTE